MVGINAARDGRTSMRIVFANTIEGILSRASGPNGRIPDSTALAMRMFEATAHPWIRDDKLFLEEIEAAKKLTGDALTLARWTAVLAGLQRAQMLDKTPGYYDRVTSDEDVGVSEEA